MATIINTETGDKVRIEHSVKLCDCTPTTLMIYKPGADDAVHPHLEAIHKDDAALRVRRHGEDISPSSVRGEGENRRKEEARLRVPRLTENTQHKKNK